MLLAALCCHALAQTAPPPHTPPSEAVRAHFAAAQRAQQQGEYSIAEREYRAVLADEPDFAEAYMNLGLVFQLQNRIPEATAEFRHALKIKPALAGANFFLGVDYCKGGEGARAIPFLRAAARQDPNRPDIWSWLAIAQELSGDTRGEVATLKQGLSISAHNVDLLYLLGHAYERMGKHEVAELEKTMPGSSWSEQLLGESYSASSEWPFAIIRFQNALAASPRPGLHAEMGEVFLRVGRLDQAAQEFEQELQIDPNSLRALVRRGEVKLIRGEIDAALQDWTRATSIDMPRAERILGIRQTGFGDAASDQFPDSLREQLPALPEQVRMRDDPASHLAVAFVAALSAESTPSAGDVPKPGTAVTTDQSQNNCVGGRVREALNAGRFSSVSGCLPRILTPQSSTAMRLQIAQALFELGDYERSLDALAGLSGSEQHSPQAFYWRARCFERLATSAYLRLYQADPNSYRVHQLQGDLEAAKDNDRKAIEEYRAAIAIKPAVPNLHYSLGHVLWKNLKTAEARTEFAAELALNPRHVGALHDLGDTYLLEHQTEKALQYLKRALEIDPGDPDLHRDLGTGYADLRDYPNAIIQFKVALPGDHDGSVHYKLGRAYQAMGQKDEAAREFAISTSLNRESHAKLEKQTERLSVIERTPQEH